MCHCPMPEPFRTLASRSGDWGGRPENVKEAQEALVRAKANSLAQLGKNTGEVESDEAKKGVFVKGYVH